MLKSLLALNQVEFISIYLDTQNGALEFWSHFNANISMRKTAVKIPLHVIHWVLVRDQEILQQGVTGITQKNSIYGSILLTRAAVA